MTSDSEFAKVLGKSDAHEIAVRLDAVKKDFLGARSVSALSARVEEVITEVYFASKQSYPEVFRSDAVAPDYRESLARTLLALGYISMNPATTPS